MENSIKVQIYNEYLKNRATYLEYATTLEHLIENIVKDRDIQCNSIIIRVKEEASFKEKINKKDKYNSVDDVTDIVGIRIITYYSDDVDKIAKAIEEEFEIDKENSIDKRKLLDPDRFGYLSLHYIIKMKSDRLKLTEYKKFEKFKAEIQIRTILQHSWAEIEHDLGYKSSKEIPVSIKRDFYRLAGLLEIADKEFKEIRDKLEEYSQNVINEMNNEPKNVLIDKVSLKAFLENNSHVKEIDKSIADSTNGEIKVSAYSISLDYLISRKVAQLSYIEFNTIDDIEKSLISNKDLCIKFAKEYLGEDREPDIFIGTSLFYLCFIELASKGNVEKLCEYLTCFNLSIDQRYYELAEEILQIYEKIRK